MDCICGKAFIFNFLAATLPFFLLFFCFFLTFFLHFVVLSTSFGLFQFSMFFCPFCCTFWGLWWFYAFFWWFFLFVFQFDPLFLLPFCDNFLLLVLSFSVLFGCFFKILGFCKAEKKAITNIRNTTKRDKKNINKKKLKRGFRLQLKCEILSQVDKRWLTVRGTSN